MEACGADSDCIPEEARGQVRQITAEVTQDKHDPTLFEVSGKDKSWFVQKGAVAFKCDDPANFNIGVSFAGESLNRFGDDYAELSRAEQAAAINWLLMLGVAPAETSLTGYRDCNAGGFYFLLHLNYRRTAWRVICCPHNAELEDTQGRTYTCNPQLDGQFEVAAREGQTLCVEYADGELWLREAGVRVARGRWGGGGASEDPAKLPDGTYVPAVLTSNCPTRFRAVVDGGCHGAHVTEGASCE